MKILIDDYTFDASEKTIVFNDYTTITLNGILLITNVTDNTIIYNFADPAKGGSVTNNILTLTYNTVQMNDTDKLQIFYDDKLSGKLGIIERIALAALGKLNIDTSGRLRVSAESCATHAVTITGGTVTTVTNLTNWGTMTAISRTQADTDIQYEQGYRRNLVVTT
jgi:hypothetical protein